MEHAYRLSCESTVDMPYSYIAGRGISVLFYTYTVDGKEYFDDMGRDPEALPRFYRFLEEGKIPSTSQINTFRYEEYFDRLLKEGDVLHIAFGSGMTPSVDNALEAAEKLKEKYPDRKLTVIDSYCSSSGYGFLVDSAADLWARGCSMEEVESWTRANAKRVHHQFFSTDLKYFRRSGRVTGAAATVAAVLDICPIMRLDDGGRIIAYSKVRGKKNAIRETLRTMARYAEGGLDYSGKCFISHSNCMDMALNTRKALLEMFPKVKEVPVYDIGTIIASHCGPGTVAVYFLGEERLSEEERKKRKG